MTIQNQEIDVRNKVGEWVDNLEDKMETNCPYINTIDLQLRDVALDILYGIGEQSKTKVLRKLSHIEQYTGSPDLMCPTPLLEVINNLRFLIGE
jgi:hypothetical protein